ILLQFTLAYSIFGLSAVTLAQPNVTTDQADYPPGTTVCISGAGFYPLETVKLQVRQISSADNDRPEHQPWQVLADAEGAFQASWFVTLHELGATLQLTALGDSSGLKAQTLFTDATVTPATGGAAIPADTAGGSFTALTGPVIVETIVGDISIGTIVL